jgi:hypothetical protein
MRTLTPRERRAMALLLLVLLVVLAQALLVAPLVQGFADRAADRAALTRQYEVNQRLIASIPRLRRMAERQRGGDAAYALLVPGPAAGHALLEARLLAAVEAVGGELRSNEEAGTDAGRVAVRVGARLTLRQLTALIAVLQDRSPYLSIDALAINADQAVISQTLEPMDVSLEASVPLGRPAPR